MAVAIRIFAALIAASAAAPSGRAEAPASDTMIEVEFTLPNAPLDAVAGQITPLIENDLGAAEGLRFMVSWSRAQQSRLVLTFKPGIGESAALADVRQQIARAMARLPPGTGEPALRPVAPDRQAVAYIAFLSDRFVAGDITRIVEPQVREALQGVPGVSALRLSGAQREIGRIYVDRARLAAYGLSIDALRAALLNSGIQAAAEPPAGDELRFTFPVRSEPETVGNLVVAVSNGVPVRMRDVARIERGYAHDGVVARYDRAIALVLEVEKSPGAGTAETTRALAAALQEIFIRLPAGLSHKTGFACDRCIARPRR